MIMVPVTESQEKVLPEEAARKQIHSYEQGTPTRYPNHQALVS
jgi:hypothetical protein